MVDRSRIRLLTGTLASVTLPGLLGCVGPPYEGPPPRGYAPYYYDYYYYPHADVYFHVYTGWYYYHDHGRWRRVQRLPPHMRLDRRHRHLLNIREKNPWQRHDEHRRKYPPPPKRRRDGDPGLKRVPSPGTPGAAPLRRPERRVSPPEPRRSPGPEPAPQRPERRTPSPEIRRGTPPARQKERPPPEHRRDRERDREEREHNVQRHKEYREKPWRLPRD